MLKNSILGILIFFSISSYSQTAKVGEQSPKFQLFLEDGTEINQKNTKGKVLVFKFWFTTCQACIVDFSELNALVIYVSIVANFKAQTFQFITKLCLNKQSLNYA